MKRVAHQWAVAHFRGWHILRGFDFGFNLVDGLQGESKGLVVVRETIGAPLLLRAFFKEAK